jgi:hypothetical protein
LHERRRPNRVWAHQMPCPGRSAFPRGCPKTRTLA